MPVGVSKGMEPVNPSACLTPTELLTASLGKRGPPSILLAPSLFSGHPTTANNNGRRSFIRAMASATLQSWPKRNDFACLPTPSIPARGYSLQESLPGAVLRRGRDVADSDDLPEIPTNVSLRKSTQLLDSGPRRTSTSVSEETAKSVSN